jgi:hypothetical protein
MKTRTLILLAAALVAGACASRPANVKPGECAPLYRWNEAKQVGAIDFNCGPENSAHGR